MRMKIKFYGTFFLTIFLLFFSLYIVDSVLMHYKSLDSTGLDLLDRDFTAYLASIIPSASATPVSILSMSSRTHSHSHSHGVSWQVSAHACPLYLLGRYRKMARDVPQSPWTVANSSGSRVENGVTDASAAGVEESELEQQREIAHCGIGTGNSNKIQKTEHAINIDPIEVKSMTEPVQSIVSEVQYQRKGRCSVEEIISAAVAQRLHGSECRMHACGREDIDVRCLGE